MLASSIAGRPARSLARCMDGPLLPSHRGRCCCCCWRWSLSLLVKRGAVCQSPLRRPSGIAVDVAAGQSETPFRHLPLPPTSKCNTSYTSCVPSLKGGISRGKPLNRPGNQSLSSMNRETNPIRHLFMVQVCISREKHEFYVISNRLPLPQCLAW